MRKQGFLGALSLFIAAFIWGTAFVAQDTGMDYIEPFTFQAVRSFIGSLFLLIIIYIRDSFKKFKPELLEETKPDSKATFIGGIYCGIVLTVAACFQQFGIKYSTVGKAGFITALYVIFVPLCSLFFKKKVRPIIFVSVFLATVGLYLLCMVESFSLSFGDTLLLICAFSYTAHIIVIDKFSPKADCIKLSCVQFFVAGILATILMFIFETPNIEAILKATGPLLYTGVLSSGIAYTLQIIGQKYTEPAVASLMMSLESVFAVLAGAVVLTQIPTIYESAGCLILFLAIVIAQIPPRKKAE